MGMLQEIILIIDHIALISWHMRPLQELFSIGIQTRIFVSIDNTMLGLMNIIIIPPQITSTHPIVHPFNKILRLFFVILICSTWFHVRFILYPLHFVIQKFLCIRFIYLLMERILVFIYWIMNILQYLMSLIISQIFQPVINFQHRIIKCVDHSYQIRIICLRPRRVLCTPAPSDSML